jgi:cytochrome c553
MHVQTSTRRALVFFLPTAIVTIAVGTWIGASRAGRTTPGEAVVAMEVPAEVPGVFATVCATCHGAAGEGKREMMTPSIASLPRWYIEEQLRKFRAGHRGVDPGDVDGQKMRATILALSEDALSEAVNSVLALPPAKPEPSIEGGDLENGDILYETYCMGCHRYNGHGELAFRSAPLAGLPDWYLAAQMAKFRKGIRGAHPEDADGVKMRDAARLPVDDDEIRDILTFVARLAERYPVVKSTENRD